MEDETPTPMLTEENEEQISADVESKNEEKGYLARDEYTSERFKLELNNLPKYFGFGVSEKFALQSKSEILFNQDLKKRLKLLGVNFVKIKVPKAANHAYVNFR